MATTILNKVADELAELEKQLHQFKSSVEYINNAKDKMTTALNAVEGAENYHLQQLDKIEKAYQSHNKIVEEVHKLSEKINTIDFPQRLTSIDKGLSEVINGIEKGLKASLEEVKLASKTITKIDFDNKFKNLETIINRAKENVDSSKVKIETGLANVHQKNTEYAVKVQVAVEESNNAVIVALNKLNFPERITKLDANIVGIMAAIESVQSRLDSMERNITDRIKDMIDLQKEAQITLLANIESANKRQRVFTYLTWGLIIVAVIVLKLIIK